MIRNVMVILTLLIGPLPPGVTGGQKKHDVRPPAPPAAKEAADRYYKLSLDGARLTSEGCAECDKLRIGPSTHVPRSIDVIEKVSLSEGVLSGPDVAVVDVWYSGVGTLDMVTGVLRSDTAGVLVRGDLKLKQVEGAWKVVDETAVAFIRVSAAQRYVKGLMGTSKDPVVRRNAQRTLAALNRFATQDR